MTLYRHADGALSEVVGTELVVFVPDPEALHLLDPQARLVWELAHHSSVDAVAGEIATRFPEAAGVADDVGAALRLLVAKGLLVPDDHPSEQSG